MTNDAVAAAVGRLRTALDYVEDARGEDVFVAKGDIRALLDHLEGLEKAIRTLFEKIKHGDDAHQAWLKAAIEEHFAGLR